MKRMAVLFRSNSGAKPNPVKGFYTALAMVLPLLVLTMLGQSAFGVLVMTGALLTSFGDIGTSYHTQAWSLGMTAVGGALMTARGRLIGGPWWVEIVCRMASGNHLDRRMDRPRDYLSEPVALL